VYPAVLLRKRISADINAYKKAFDKVNRNKLIEILTEDNIPNQLITAIYEIYKHNLIAVRLQAETSEWKIINYVVRQVCSLSPLLFIPYVNKIVQKRKVTRHDNIPINRDVNIDTMLFADDQLLLAKSEDDLQYSVHNLNKIASEFSMEINAEKSRVMAFRGMEPIRSKICINNKTLKQQNMFNYLGHNIS
jgi:TusA-related sulfurtransferase